MSSEQQLIRVIGALTRALRHLTLSDDEDALEAQLGRAGGGIPRTESRDCECERWRDGATWCPLHEVGRPDLCCGAVAISCMPADQAGACPREGHEHESCTRPTAHDGRHSWQVQPHDDRDASDPHATPPIVFALPGRPPTESEVIDKHGATWICEASGLLRCTDVLFGLVGPDDDPDDATVLGAVMMWPGLLADRGPVTLVPDDQDPTDKALYGPHGARWGTPTAPCPYSGPHGVDGTGPSWPCTLGQGHAGPHTFAGVTLGETNPGGPPMGADANISPQRAAETPCTCGHPAAHRPGCPRYARTTGEDTYFEPTDG